MGKIQVEKEDKNIAKDKKLINRKKVSAKGSMDVEKPRGIKKKVIKQTIEQIKQKSLKKKVKSLNPENTQIQNQTQKKIELYKEFSKNVEQQLAVPKTFSKGQKERLLKKQKVMKRKLLDNYLTTKQKQEPQTFILESLKNNLMEIDKQNQDQQKLIELDKNKGTSTHMRNKLLKEDQNRMKQVFQIKMFQDNPLATMKMHLENTYAKK